jgi:hypothetical protein
LFLFSSDSLFLLNSKFEWWNSDNSDLSFLFFSRIWSLYRFSSSRRFTLSLNDSISLKWEAQIWVWNSWLFIMSILSSLISMSCFVITLQLFWGWSVIDQNIFGHCDIFCLNLWYFDSRRLAFVFAVSIWVFLPEIWFWS